MLVKESTEKKGWVGLFFDDDYQETAAFRKDKAIELADDILKFFNIDIKKELSEAVPRGVSPYYDRIQNIIKKLKTK